MGSRKPYKIEDFAPTPQTQSLRELIFSTKENLEDHLELSRVMAKIIKSKYDAYIAEGFTEQQALELCKGR